MTRADSPSFDPKAYFEHISGNSLPDLMKRENDLLDEIRELGSERQSLVYNHHHELIAASDTISAVSRFLSLIPNCVPRVTALMFLHIYLILIR